MTELQKVILEIFKEVKKVCDKNNITYYGIAGTCLGAVRHEGFIPWDDDLDISIPIEEFDRFIACARKELPEYLDIVSYHDHPHFPRMFVRVTDKRTTYVQYYMKYYPDEYHGVFIDVMPMTGKPAGISGKLFEKKAVLFDYLTQQTIRLFRDNDAIREKISWVVLKCFFFLPKDYFLRKWEEELRKHPVKGSKLVLFAWNAKVRYRTFPAEVFEKSLELEFEGENIKFPADTDTYLKVEYGDYMKLPPEEKRVGHHYGRVDLKMPYAVFSERMRKKLHERCKGRLPG